MKEKLRKYLESVGLKTAASDVDAFRFMESLEGDALAQAQALAAEKEPVAVAPVVAPAVAAPVPDASVALAEATKAAQLAERQRGVAIRAIATKHSLDESWSEQMVNGGFSLDEVRAAALDKIAIAKAPVRIAVGEDANKSTIDVAITDALMNRASLQLYDFDARENVAKKRKAHDRAYSFRGMRMTSLARAWLQGHGLSTEGLTDNEVGKLSFDRGALAAHGTSDFANITLNALNKILRAEYVEQPQKWTQFARRVTAPDFKNIYRIQLGEAPAMLSVPEGAEYKLVTIGDAKEVYALVKYGRSFELTWEAMINDDVDAFTRTPRLMYNAATRIEDYNAFSVLNNGLTTPNMGDGNLLFDATNHTNYTSSGTAVSVASLNVAKALMRKQTGLTSSVYIDVVPKYLLAPTAIEGTVQSILRSVADPATSNANAVNIWNGQLTPIFSPWLDANSATKWYLCADYNQIDTVEMAFLEGYEAPSVEQVDTQNPDVRKFNVRHVNAAKAIDWRGLYLNAGA